MSTFGRRTDVEFNETSKCDIKKLIGTVVVVVVVVVFRISLEPSGHQHDCEKIFCGQSNRF